MKTNGSNGRTLVASGNGNSCESGAAVIVIPEDCEIRLDLRIRDEEVYEFFAECPPEDREALARRAIKTGVQVLGYSKAVTGVDYVQKHFNGLAQRMDESVRQAKDNLHTTIEDRFNPSKRDSYTFQLKALGQETEDRLKKSVGDAAKQIDERVALMERSFRANFDPKDADSYSGKLKTHADKLKQDLERLIDPAMEGSVTARLRRDIDDYFSEHGKIRQILGSALSLDDATAPLARFKREMDRQIVEIRDLLRDQETARGIIATTPLKGIAFEDRLKEALSTTLLGHSDTLDDVRNQPGKMQGREHGKKGDFTVDFDNDPARRVVIESKDEKGLSSKRACTLLDQAMQNREARFGIFVLASAELLPNDRVCWQLYDDNKIVCSFDEDGRHLDIALRYARGQLSVLRAEADGLDVTGIRKRLKQVRSAMGKLQQASKEADGVRRGVEKMILLVKAAEATAVETLDDIEALLDAEPAA